jgi:ATP-binding cassette, subfamily F, member 3
VLREAYSAAPGYMAETMVRTILAAFLFTGDDSDKYVKVLSGGEKSRLILAKLLVNPPNFLLLDEPTTHLDVDAVDALIRALHEYQGTIVFISHDIHFVRSVANNVYEVKDGCVRKFPGGFDYYFEKKGQLPEMQQQKRQAAPEKLRQEDERQKAREAEKFRREDERRRKNHNASIREKIQRLDKEKEKLSLEQYAKTRALSNPHIFRDEETAASYGRRLKEIDKELAELNGQIAKLEEQIVA